MKVLTSKSLGAEKLWPGTKTPKFFQIFWRSSWSSPTTLKIQIFQ